LVVPETELIAAVMLTARFAALPSRAIAPTLVPLIVRSPAVMAVNAVAAAPVTCATVDVPRFALCASTMEPMVIVSPTLAPTWKALLVKEPSISLVPLNNVVEATRSISDFSAEASV
jgi:hypothetical protein